MDRAVHQCRHYFAVGAVMSTYTVIARDDNGEPATGLTPTFMTWRYLDNTDPAGDAPSIIEVSAANAPGFYKFTFAPTKTLCYTVDLGDTITDNDRRYIDGIVTPDDDATTESRMASIATATAGTEALLSEIAASIDVLLEGNTLLQSIAGKRNQVVRNISYTTINGESKPTSMQIRAFANAEDASLDQNAVLTLTVTTTYNNLGQPTRHVTTE